MGQYVFISSASAYQTPPGRLPVLESTPLRNPFWQYSRDKIACEDLLVKAYRDEGLPATIVRPSHTYDKTLLPMDGGWTVVDRMRRGAEVVVHGDGTSLWTLTHNTDFAKAFVGLLGHPAAIGDSFHITSDEWLSWNEIFTLVGRAAGVEPRLVHVPSDAIAAADPEWGAGLLGDKAHSMIFDNTKVRRLVPDSTAVVGFHTGAREIIDWYDADPARQQVDAAMDATMDHWWPPIDRPRSSDLAELPARRAGGAGHGGGQRHRAAHCGRPGRGRSERRLPGSAQPRAGGGRRGDPAAGRLRPSRCPAT